MTIQEAKLNIAMEDLRKAEEILNGKEAELQEVQSFYDKAVKEKQVNLTHLKRSKITLFLY